MRSARFILPLLLLTVLGIVAAAVGIAGAGGAGHTISGSISVKITDYGKEEGSRISGVAGNGSFSGKASGTAARLERALSSASGVSPAVIAAGGRISFLYDISAGGGESGLVWVKFKTAGAGSACLRFTTRHGAYKPGESFIPTTGTLSLIGATGGVARNGATASFTQTDITGSTIQTYSGGGTVKMSSGRVKPPSAACQKVAKLL